MEGDIFMHESGTDTCPHEMTELTECIILHSIVPLAHPLDRSAEKTGISVWSSIQVFERKKKKRYRDTKIDADGTNCGHKCCHKHTQAFDVIQLRIDEPKDSLSKIIFNL
jgi:hypothetical protein